MGTRMDALRVWSEPAEKPRLLVTSLNAVLQRIPPLKVIKDSRNEVTSGGLFDRDAFEAFVRATGYAVEGVADEPGELAIREGVIDIFPAGAPVPMRIMLSDDHRVLELRSYDPATQRTAELQETMVFGPASETVGGDAAMDDERLSRSMELRLLRLYDTMPTVFDVLGQSRVAFAPGTEARLGDYLDIIDDARTSSEKFGVQDGSHSRSLYLDRAQWNSKIATLATAEVDLAGGYHFRRPEMPTILGRAVRELLWRTCRKDARWCWRGAAALDTLCRRIEKASKRGFEKATEWDVVPSAGAGALIRLESG